MSGGVAAQQLSFSSYPGELFSDDDLYITSSKMVVLETTNHIYNFTILEVSLILYYETEKRRGQGLGNHLTWAYGPHDVFDCCVELKCNCARTSD